MHILWIEEEPGSLRYERRLVESKGWHLDNAEHTERALIQISTTHYDAVICDLILPRNQFQLERKYVDTDAGYEFIRELRRPARVGATSPGVPLLIVTANVAAGAELSSITPLNDVRLLTKPLEDRAFIDALEWVAERVSLAKHVQGSAPTSRKPTAS